MDKSKISTENKTAFHDAEASIAAYEKLSGKPMSESTKEFARVIGEIINNAYARGWQDGLEEAHV